MSSYEKLVADCQEQKRLVAIFRTELADSEKHLKYKREQFDVLQTECMALRNTLSEKNAQCNQFKKENEELHGLLSEAQKTAAKLAIENEELKTSLKNASVEKERLLALNETRTAELAKMQERFEMFQSNKDVLEKNHREQISSKNDVIKRLYNDNAALESEIEELKETLASSKTVQQSSDDARQERNALVEENEKLKKVLFIVESQRKYEKFIVECGASCSTIIGDQKSRIIELEKEVRLKIIEFENLQEEMAELKAENDGHVQLCRQSSLDFQTAQKKIAKLKVTKKELQKRVLGLVDIVIADSKK